MSKFAQIRLEILEEELKWRLAEDYRQARKDEAQICVFSGAILTIFSGTYGIMQGKFQRFIETIGDAAPALLGFILGVIGLIFAARYWRWRPVIVSIVHILWAASWVWAGHILLPSEVWLAGQIGLGFVAPYLYAAMLYQEALSPRWTTSLE